jgi:hypothetical protein
MNTPPFWPLSHLAKSRLCSIRLIRMKFLNPWRNDPSLLSQNVVRSWNMTNYVAPDCSCAMQKHKPSAAYRKKSYMSLCSPYQYLIIFEKTFNFINSAAFNLQGDKYSKSLCQKS